MSASGKQLGTHAMRTLGSYRGLGVCQCCPRSRTCFRNKAFVRELSFTTVAALGPKFGAQVDVDRLCEDSGHPAKQLLSVTDNKIAQNNKWANSVGLRWFETCLSLAPKQSSSSYGLCCLASQIRTAIFAQIRQLQSRGDKFTKDFSQWVIDAT